MKAGGQKRQKEYDQHLRIYSLFDFFSGHANLLHNIEALPIFVTFRYLLIVYDQDRRNQEHDAQEYAEEKHPAVYAIELRSGDRHCFYPKPLPILIRVRAHFRGLLIDRFKH